MSNRNESGSDISHSKLLHGEQGSKLNVSLLLWWSAKHPILILLDNTGTNNFTNNSGRESFPHIRKFPSILITVNKWKPLIFVCNVFFLYYFRWRGNASIRRLKTFQCISNPLRVLPITTYPNQCLINTHLFAWCEKGTEASAASTFSFVLKRKTTGCTRAVLCQYSTWLFFKKT